jgi:fumarate hydratase, class II
MRKFRKETDSLGGVPVPADKVWREQTQLSLEHFSTGKVLIPGEMITTHAVLKKDAASANFGGKRFDQGESANGDR